MITRKTRLWQFAICLCFLIFLASCGEPPEIPKRPDFDGLPTPGGISETLTARIYFDATVSMKGFVVPGQTHYTRMLQRSLEGVVVRQKGWKAKFFRFGTQVESIDRTTYLRVAHPEFYNDDTINKKTLIQKVIDYETQEVNNREAANNDNDEVNNKDEEANSEPMMRQTV